MKVKMAGFKTYIPQGTEVSGGNTVLHSGKAEMQYVPGEGIALISKQGTRMIPISNVAWFELFPKSETDTLNLKPMAKK